jgi:hypothetical protein
MHRILLHRRTWMSRYDATYVRQGVVVRRGNSLGGAVRSVEKLVITYELVKKL